MSFLDNIAVLSTQVSGYLKTLAGTVTGGNRIAVDLGGASLTGSFSADIPDNTGTGTLSALNSAVSVATEGRAHAGFAIGAGFSGVITFEASFDGGTTWVAVQSLSAGTEPPTIATTLAVSTAAIGCGILVPVGATNVRARVSTATSGTASATIRATVAGVLYALPQLDTLHTDLAVITAAVIASRMQVDLATTPTSNLATLAGAITSARMAVNVDSTTTGKLDTLHTDLNTTLHTDLTTLAPSSCGTPFQFSVTTGAAQQLTGASCAVFATIKNISTSNQLVTIGKSSATTSNAFQLAVGEETRQACRNTNEFYAVASASGANICVMPC